MAAEHATESENISGQQAAEYRALGEDYVKSGVEISSPISLDGEDAGRVVDKGLAEEAAYAAKPEIDQIAQIHETAANKAASHEAKAHRARLEDNREQHLQAAESERARAVDGARGLVEQADQKSNLVISGAIDTLEGKHRVRSVREAETMAYAEAGDREAEAAIKDSKKDMELAQANLAERGLGNVLDEAIQNTSSSEAAAAADQKGAIASEVYRRDLSNSLHLTLTKNLENDAGPRVILYGKELQCSEDMRVALGAELAPFNVEKFDKYTEKHAFKTTTNPDVLLIELRDTATGKLVALETFNKAHPIEVKHRYYSQSEILKSRIEARQDPSKSILQNSWGEWLRHRVGLPQNIERPVGAIRSSFTETLKDHLEPLSKSERKLTSSNQPSGVDVSAWVMEQRGASSEQLADYRKRKARQRSNWLVRWMKL